MDQQTIRAACREFGCEALPASWAEFESKERRKRRQTVTTTAERFLSLMISSTPPRTEDEAVRMIVGAWLLQRLVFRLAVEVVRWLWRHYHNKV